jgi:hypothetical protein
MFVIAQFAKFFIDTVTKHVADVLSPLYMSQAKPWLTKTVGRMGKWDVIHIKQIKHEELEKLANTYLAAITWQWSPDYRVV